MKGAILISIIVTTLIGIPFGVTSPQETTSFTEACQALPTTFLAIFKEGGIGSLFSDVSKLPLVLITIFSFSISDTFDTIGTFIGTGRRSGIFSAEDEKKMESSSGFHSKLDKALFADATATSIGSLFGTSNTTTFVESAAGIGVGGRTGLTSVVVAICFALSAFLASFVSAVPFAATAPALVAVGIMMMSSFKDIDWSDFNEAVPAFFAGIFMAALLQYLLRYCRRIYFLLHHQDLQRQGKGNSPDSVGLHCTVCPEFCSPGSFVKLQWVEWKGDGNRRLVSPAISFSPPLLPQGSCQSCRR